MWELPMEIIEDILSRLPVDLLLVFRCVSKSWCSLIDSSDFVKIHLNRSVEHHTNLTLILEGMHNPISDTTLYSLDLGTLDAAIEFDNQFKNYDFSGSCNGLLLLQHPYNGKLVLFNPSTRKYWNLPENRFDYHALDDSLNAIIRGKVGLGYDLYNDDYNVIKIVQVGKSIESVKTQAMVYSLKSNLWKKIGDFPYFLHTSYNYMLGAQCNCALHMVVNECYNGDSRKLIAAFDINKGSFYLVPQPDFCINRDVDMNVGVLGECLYLVGANDANHIYIWVMADYGVKESWAKLASISPAKIIDFRVTLYPARAFVNILYYSKRRNEVLLTFDHRRLLWYDLEKRTAMDVSVHDLPRLFYAKVCVRSLVPLHGSG